MTNILIQTYQTLYDHPSPGRTQWLCLHLGARPSAVVFTRSGWHEALHTSMEYVVSDSGNGLPTWCHTISWTKADWLPIAPLWTNCSDISIKIHQFCIRTIPLKMSSAPHDPCCIVPGVLLCLIGIPVTCAVLANLITLLPQPYLPLRPIQRQIWSPTGSGTRPQISITIASVLIRNLPGIFAEYLPLTQTHLCSQKITGETWSSQSGAEYGISE